MKKLKPFLTVFNANIIKKLLKGSNMTDILKKLAAKRPPKRVPASFQIDADQDRRIRELAESHKMSVSELYRALVESGLAELEKSLSVEICRSCGLHSVEAPETICSICKLVKAAREVDCGQGSDCLGYGFQAIEEALESFQTYKREPMKLVKCSNCGVETRNQPEGDGCHACLGGVMRAVEEEASEKEETEAEK
jgi:ribosomal protein L37E